MYPSGGDKMPSTQIYCITFKHIPASERTFHSKLLRVEDLLRARYPTFEIAMKTLLESNHVTGNYYDTNIWSYVHDGTEYFRAPPNIQGYGLCQIVNHIRLMG